MRDLRKTCGTSPRPTTRSARMVNLNCSRQLASIPSVRQARWTPPAMSSGALSGAALSCSVLYGGYPDFRRTARTIAHFLKSHGHYSAGGASRASPRWSTQQARFIEDRSGIPSTRTACRLANSWPLTQIFIGTGSKAHTLMNAGPKSSSRRRSSSSSPAAGTPRGEPHRLAPLLLVAVNTAANSWAIPIAATPPGRRLPGQIRPHHIDLAISLAEPHHRDSVVLGERHHSAANAVPIFSRIAGDGIGLPRCWVRKLMTCPPTCRFGRYRFG